MRTFSELELDALAEAFNLSLGEAAATFSAIVREEIEPGCLVLRPHGREGLRACLLGTIGEFLRWHFSCSAG